MKVPFSKLSLPPDRAPIGSRPLGVRPFNWRTLSLSSLQSLQHAQTLYPSHNTLPLPSWRPLASVITTLYYVAVLSMCQSRMLQTLYLSSSSVVWQAFSMGCVYLMFGHHPRPLGYLCAKLYFFCNLRCWPRPQRKINQSLTHSPSLFDAPETKALVLRNIWAVSEWVCRI